MEQLHLDHLKDLEPIQINGSEKMLYLHSYSSPINSLSLARATEILKEAMEDLPEFVKAQESAEAQFQLMGVNEPQGFTIELDNEFDLPDDPLLEADDDYAEVEFMDDAKMPKSLEFETIVVDKDEDSYWEKVNAQPNLPDYIKTHLAQVYKVYGRKFRNA